MEIRQLIVTLLLSCFYGLYSYSQAILDREHNIPRIGDKLSKVSLMDIDYSFQEIDLRGKVLDGKEQTIEFFAMADSCSNIFSKIDDGIIYHYACSANNLYLLGYESNLVKMSFNVPMKLVRYPLMQGDTVCCNFEGTGNSTQAGGGVRLHRDYCGDFIHEDGALKTMLFDGGYVTFSGTTPEYHFYLKDHLGNNRIVANANGDIEQVNHYYPFGGLRYK